MRLRIAPVFLVAALAMGAKPINKDADLEVREQMVVMSRQLGVTCSYCHRLDDFRNADLKPFQIAKDHIRITELLNKQGFKGKPKADCFMCHRGAAQPAFKESIPSPKHKETREHE